MVVLFHEEAIKITSLSQPIGDKFFKRKATHQHPNRNNGASIRFKYVSQETSHHRHSLSILRQISVAFRSAKVAFLHPFAERKTTIKNRKMLN